MNPVGKAIVGLEILLGCIGCSTKAINTDGKPQQGAYQTDAYSVKPKIDSIKSNYSDKIKSLSSDINSLLNAGGKAAEVKGLYGRLHDTYVNEAQDFLRAAKKEQRLGHRRDLIEQAIGSYSKARELTHEEGDAQRIQELRMYRNDPRKMGR